MLVRASCAQVSYLPYVMYIVSPYLLDSIDYIINVQCFHYSVYYVPLRVFISTSLIAAIYLFITSRCLKYAPLDVLSLFFTLYLHLSSLTYFRTILLDRDRNSSSTLVLFSHSLACSDSSLSRLSIVVSSNRPLSIHFLFSSLRSSLSRASFSKSISIGLLFRSLVHDRISPQHPPYLPSSRSSTNLRLSSNSFSSLAFSFDFFRPLSLSFSRPLCLSFFLFFLPIPFSPCLVFTYTPASSTLSFAHRLSPLRYEPAEPRRWRHGKKAALKELHIFYALTATWVVQNGRQWCNIVLSPREALLLPPFFSRLSRRASIYRGKSTTSSSPGSPNERLSGFPPDLSHVHT